MLFSLITYQIIEALQQQTQGFTNEKFHILPIIYADDGLLLANNHQDAEESIQKLTEIARTNGLEMNKEKSIILIHNLKEQPESIEGIKVEKSIHYLEVKITNSRNYLKEQS